MDLSEVDLAAARYAILCRPFIAKLAGDQDFLALTNEEAGYLLDIFPTLIKYEVATNEEHAFFKLSKRKWLARVTNFLGIDERALTNNGYALSVEEFCSLAGQVYNGAMIDRLLRLYDPELAKSSAYKAYLNRSGSARANSRMLGRIQEFALELMIQIVIDCMR